MYTPTRSPSLPDALRADRTGNALSGHGAPPAGRRRAWTADRSAGPVAIKLLRSFDGLATTAGATLGVGVFAAAIASLARRGGTVTLLVAGPMPGFAVRGIVSVVIPCASRVGRFERVR